MSRRTLTTNTRITPGAQTPRGRARSCIRVCLLGGLALFGCENKPKPLEPPPKCETPEVVACLQPYAFEKLADSEIERLVNEGIPKCLPDDPVLLSRQGTCLPLEMGTKGGNDAPVALSYRCRRPRDCASSAFPILEYPETIRLRDQPNRCCAAGGYPFRTKWDWNYNGCLVKEFAERYKERIGLLDSACRGDQEGPIKEPPREGY